MKLQIDNKEYGLLWGLGAFEIACDRLNIDMAKLDEGIATGNQKVLFNFVYSAIVNWAEVNEVDINITYRQFQAWVDQAPQNTATDIMDDYMKSKWMGKTMQEYYDELWAEKESKTVKKSKKK